MASQLGYAVLGFIAGPIGGAVAGYLYAAKENEIAAKQGNPPQKTEFMSAALGTIFGPFGGAYYGFKLAETQTRLDEINAQPITLAQAPTVRILQASQEQDMSQSKWQDKVVAERETQPSQTTQR